MHPPKGVMGLEASGEARADRRRALNSGCVCHPAHRWHGSAANAVRATTACRAVSEFSLCIKWMSWFTTESESMVHRAAMEDAATLERMQAPKNENCSKGVARWCTKRPKGATQGGEVAGGIATQASPKEARPTYLLHVSAQQGDERGDAVAFRELIRVRRHLGDVKRQPNGLRRGRKGHTHKQLL